MNAGQRFETAGLEQIHGHICDGIGQKDYQAVRSSWERLESSRIDAMAAIPAMNCSVMNSCMKRTESEARKIVTRKEKKAVRESRNTSIRIGTIVNGMR